MVNLLVWIVFSNIINNLRYKPYSPKGQNTIYLKLDFSLKIKGISKNFLVYKWVYFKHLTTYKYVLDSVAHKSRIYQQFLVPSFLNFLLTWYSYSKTVEALKHLLKN